jgi:hypothetical protein
MNRFCSQIITYHLYTIPPAEERDIIVQTLLFIYFIHVSTESFFITFKWRLACGRSCRARGASHTTQMGIFMGTMLPHSAHKPICTKEK